MLAGAGCARCSDEPRVPFKLQPQRTGDAGAEADVPIDAGEQAARTFEAGIDRPELTAGPLPLTQVRALLESDLDRDGLRDVLALNEDAQQHAHLYAVHRTASGYAAPIEVRG